MPIPQEGVSILSYLALNSIFVQSIHSTSNVIKPFSANTTTNCVNTWLISSLTRLRKQFDGIEVGLLISGKPYEMDGALQRHISCGMNTGCSCSRK